MMEGCSGDACFGVLVYMLIALISQGAGECKQ